MNVFKFVYLLDVITSSLAKWTSTAVVYDDWMYSESYWWIGIMDLSDFSL